MANIIKNLPVPSTKAGSLRISLCSLCIPNQPLLILFTCRIKKQSYDDLNQWIKFEIRYDFLCATGYYLIKILLLSRFTTNHGRHHSKKRLKEQKKAP